MALVAFEAFAKFLQAYCICALFLKPFSSGRLALWELEWLVLFVLATAPVRVPGARRTKATKIEDYRQLSLQVTYSGQIILLRPETVVESIFATGNEELAAALFRHGASVDLLRRAIWLGCFWTRTPAIGVNDFLFLLDEAKRAKSLQHFFHNYREFPDSYWKRLRSRRFSRLSALISASPRLCVEVPAEVSDPFRPIPPLTAAPPTRYHYLIHVGGYCL